MISPVLDLVFTGLFVAATVATAVLSVRSSPGESKEPETPRPPRPPATSFGGKIAERITLGHIFVGVAVLGAVGIAAVIVAGFSQL